MDATPCKESPSAAPFEEPELRPVTVKGRCPSIGYIGQVAMSSLAPNLETDHAAMVLPLNPQSTSLAI